MVGTFQPVILVFGGVAFISRPCLFLDLFHQIFWTCPSFIRSWISKKRRHGCHWNHPLKNWVASFWKLKTRKEKRWQVTAKATVLFATTASFGMLVMSMQNLGLIGMMTVEWPSTLDGIFSICKFLLLDIDSYGFSCIAGWREWGITFKKTRPSNLFVTSLGWLNDPFNGESWPPTIGDKKVTAAESPGRCILQSKYPASQISVVSNETPTDHPNRLAAEDSKNQHFWWA